MSQQRSVRRGAAWLWAAFLMLAAGLGAPEIGAKPVLMELFISEDAACSGCRYAEEAAAQLRTLYSVDELHLLVHRVDGEDPLFESQARAVRYGVDLRDVSRLPLAVFDGAQTIAGANRSILNAYQDRIRNRMDAPVNVSLGGWLRVTANQLVFSATFPEGTPPADLDLYLALTEDDGPQRVGRVFYFDSQAKLDTPFFIQIPSLVEEDEVLGYLFLQNSVTGVVEASVRLTNAAPIAVDLNQDGRRDANDVFLFARAWQDASEVVDLDGDGEVTALDLVLFLSPQTPLTEN